MWISIRRALRGSFSYNQAFRPCGEVHGRCSCHNAAAADAATPVYVRRGGFIPARSKPLVCRCAHDDLVLMKPALELLAIFAPPRPVQ
jgi:hypothetical protein